MKGAVAHGHRGVIAPLGNAGKVEAGAHLAMGTAHLAGTAGVVLALKGAGIVVRAGNVSASVGVIRANAVNPLCRCRN